MTFMLDAVQYIAVAGGPPGGGGRGGGRGGGEPAGPAPPSRLLALALDGTTPLPVVQIAEEEEED